MPALVLASGRVSVVVAIALLLATPALGGPPTVRLRGVSSSENGSQAWALCGSSSEGVVPDACFAYVEGVADGLSLGAGVDAHGCERSPFCAPDGTTGAQLTDAVRHYLDSHPELRSSQAASWLVRAALVEAFPCATPPRT
jgi:hypothetical protein